MSRKQKFKQVVGGLVLIVCGVLPWAYDNDATVAFLTVPAGIALIVTKQEVLQ